MSSYSSSSFFLSKNCSEAIILTRKLHLCEDVLVMWCRLCGRWWRWDSCNQFVVRDHLQSSRPVSKEISKNIRSTRRVVVYSITSICLRDETRRVGPKTKIDLFDGGFIYVANMSFSRDAVSRSYHIDFWKTRCISDPLVLCLLSPTSLNHFVERLHVSLILYSFR